MSESRYAAAWPRPYAVSHTVHCQNRFCLLHSTKMKASGYEDPFAVALLATQVGLCDHLLTLCRLFNLATTHGL